MNTTDIAAVDADGFVVAVDEIRKEFSTLLGDEDLAHLRRIVLLGRICTVAGLATAWLAPNPISALLISQGILTRWLLMHHISHRGYDRVPGVPAPFTSRVFAQGWRRFIDWFDWIHPEAWAHEHNHLHHYHTGESQDPDLVERNVEFLRRSNLSMFGRYLRVAFLAMTWKVTYYAPSTMLALQNERRRKAGQPVDRKLDFTSLFNPMRPEGRELWLRCYLPYATFRFLLVPGLFALVAGAWAGFSVLACSVLAELITNVHAFVVIGPNHSGDDLFRFDRPAKDKREFLVRQVVGSVNYRCGTDGVDFAHAFLNYQIEHHLWPDLPMLRYQQSQPRQRDVCAQHAPPD